MENGNPDQQTYIELLAQCTLAFDNFFRVKKTILVHVALPKAKQTPVI